MTNDYITDWDDIIIGTTKSGGIDCLFEMEKDEDEGQEGFTTIVSLSVSDAKYLVSELTDAINKIEARQNTQQ
jgi:hypothetical protein